MSGLSASGLYEAAGDMGFCNIGYVPYGRERATNDGGDLDSPAKSRGLAKISRESPGPHSPKRWRRRDALPVPGGSSWL